MEELTCAIAIIVASWICGSINCKYTNNLETFLMIENTMRYHLQISSPKDSTFKFVSIYMGSLKSIVHPFIGK